VLLVVSAGLGALHDAGAAALALAHRQLRPAALVIGDWPSEPDLAVRCNLDDLPGYAGAPLGGVLAGGAGRLSPAAFGQLAVRSLTPALGGEFDAADFVARHRAPRPSATQPSGEGNR
ncbi:MAG: dethiobiotin synthase, partial [Jatrophihabitantaceae bacterium]